MNEQLKKWAAEHLGTPADATDEQIKSAIAEAFKSGDISFDDLQKTIRGEVPEDEDVKAATDMIGRAVGGAVEKAMGSVAQMFARMDERMQAIESGQEKAKDTLVAPKTTEPSEAEKLIASSAGTLPRVKSPTERYSMTKTAAIYPEKTISGRPNPRAGQPVRTRSRWFDFQSEAEAAVNGAFFKWSVTGRGDPDRNQYLNEHERELLKYAISEVDWVGDLMIGGVERIVKGRLDGQVKASLLGDTTSGGSYTVPRGFDDMIVLNAILYGELMPHVDIRETNAKVVDGSSLDSDPTITSNTAEGSAITLFDATAMIGNMDTNIYPCAVGIEIGRDYLADDAVNIGRIMPERMGLKLLEWLDNQIANGDGTTEPEGIFTKSGVGSGTAANGTAGSITIGDLERMMFGISKAERAMPGAQCRFVSNDTMYMRARSVAVGTTDARRVQGLDHFSYEVMGQPVSIQNNAANGAMAYCNLNRYVLYRRLGSEFRSSDEGSTLIKANDVIMTLRARFGGQLMKANACYKMTTLDQSQA